MQLLVSGVALSLCLGGCNLFAGDSNKDTGVTPDPSSNVEKTQEQAAGETPAGEATSPDRVVALVNGVTIPRQSFDDLFEEQVRPYRIQKKTIPPKTEQRHRIAALQKLIDQELLTQYFTRFKIVLSAEEKEQAFNKYKSRFRGAQSFKRFLKRSNKTEQDLRDQSEFEAITTKALTMNFADDLKISDDDIKLFYDKYRERKFVKPARVRVSHLLVQAPRSSGKRSIRSQKKVAKSLYKKARKMNAKEFADLVRKNSADLSTKQQGGDLNYFERKGVPMISEAFEESVAKLKVGEISEPILTSKGYHLVRLTSRQPPQVRVSHILLDPKTTEKQVAEIQKRMATESFSSLVRELSTDELTRLRGGELGFIHAQRPHRYGDEFKAACLKGMEGELIGPISTAKGKHLIYITGRRAERLRASHILVKLPRRAKRAQKKEALAKIKKISEELKKSSKVSGSLFVRLARKHSEDINRDRGGDLGNFYLGGNPKISQSFEETAFTGKVDEVLKPVLSPYGWHIIFVHDHQTRVEQPLESVSADIKGLILDKALRRAKSRLIKMLRTDAKIERYLEP
jgi:parvulin-like peptidyl-prolyl isomerase